MNSMAKSFLENFGLRAFGGWSRPVRPGMENGMFAYDESTADLFDVEEEPVDAAYVDVEPGGEVAAATGLGLQFVDIATGAIHPISEQYFLLSGRKPVAAPRNPHGQRLDFITLLGEIERVKQRVLHELDEQSPQPKTGSREEMVEWVRGLTESSEQVSRQQQERK
jgi:hypothetical protein